jgi:hypothetical protein
MDNVSTEITIHRENCVQKNILSSWGVERKVGRWVMEGKGGGEVGERRQKYCKHKYISQHDFLLSSVVKLLSFVVV